METESGSQKAQASQRAAQASAHELIRAYKVVFGLEGQRTPAQAMVWADMQKRGGLKLPSFRPNAAGEFCPIRAAVTDGRRAFVLETLEAVNASLEDLKKPEVKKP